VLRLSYPKRLMVVEVDIQVLMDELLKNQNLRALLKANKIKLVTRVEPRLPSVKADGMQMREVLLILATNACQAMPDGGTLTLSAGLENKKMIISVTDTGDGIPAEILENLFTPFFTTKHRGLGLGLCISREIVKAHSGTLDVVTEAGKGTSFSIRLPVDSDGAQ
jgi:signal transduction histidine kinase